MNVLKRTLLISLLLLTMTLFADVNPKNTDKTLLILGDSLSAGYNIPLAESWPVLLQKKLGDKISVINASISGETSAGGLRRLPTLLKQHKVDYFILALGANDGLRGLRLDQLRANLNKMLSLATSTGSQLLLVGNHIPPNYGKRYAQQFFNTFAEVATLQKANYEPFLLKNVAGIPTLMQEDGLHPNAEAQKIILDTIYKAVPPLLKTP